MQRNQTTGSSSSLIYFCEEEGTAKDMEEKRHAKVIAWEPTKWYEGHFFGNQRKMRFFRPLGLVSTKILG